MKANILNLLRLLISEKNKKLHFRKQIILGDGNYNSPILFCGEAPGYYEEMFNKPFVGPSGIFLRKVLKTMGISRNHIAITNIMNWRPSSPNDKSNRTPTLKEIKFCFPDFIAQLNIINPKIIVALGSTAMYSLFNINKIDFRNIRGLWKNFYGIPVMTTYHPAYILRNPTKQIKRIFWEDMMKIMYKMNIKVTLTHKKYFI